MYKTAIVFILFIGIINIMPSLAMAEPTSPKPKMADVPKGPSQSKASNSPAAPMPDGLYSDRYDYSVPTKDSNSALKQRIRDEEAARIARRNKRNESLRRFD